MIITISNNKGGVLKTTVATNLACQLVVEGYKVALFDLDNQCNITTTFMTISDKQKSKKNIMDLLLGDSFKNCVDININNQIQPNIFFHNNNSKGQLLFIHGSENISNYDQLVIDNKISHDKLSKILIEINKLVDYVIVDTPPNINTITKIAIENSNKVIVPFDLNYYSIDAIIYLLKQNKEKNNKYLLLPTKVSNNKTQLKNLENIKEILMIKNLKNIQILDTKISQNNLSGLIVQEQHVPQVLTMNRLHWYKKYINEYKSLICEIQKNN